jgi:uncharacterized membrane protein
MLWMKILVVVLCGLAGSFTDWLFMGVLFHNKYLQHPEVWRNSPGQNDTGKIVASSLLGVVSCVGFILLCRWTGATTLRSEVHLAGMVWLAGPVPILFSNLFWIKMHPLLGVSHSLGWLVRFITTGILSGWLLK